MKIAMVVQYAGGGTHNVAAPIAHAMEERGHEVNYAEAANWSWRDVDVVHFWNLRAARTDLIDATTLTIHHIPVAAEGAYYSQIGRIGAQRIHVFDRYAQRQLGRWGYTNVTYIPQAFYGSDRWQPMPVPDRFAVGFVGALAEEQTKRPWVGRKAAELIGVKYHEHRADHHVGIEAVRDIYERSSVYVVSGFEDAGPLPPQEALLCGRPVVTTYVGQMPDIVREGENGLFFDGSVEDCVRALREVRAHYGHFREGALRTRLRHVDTVVPLYEKMWQEVLHEG